MTNREYRRASPAYSKVVSNTAVQAAEEDKSPDFSREAPQMQIDAAAAPIAFNQKEMGRKIRKYFLALPEISGSL